jgi:acetolactate synthase I/II/III large subunit
VFVVFVDGSLNRIELKQMVQGYESTATRIEDMDLVAMAEAMDCDGIRVDSVDALTKALDDVGRLTRPLVVEAHVDPSQYESQF